MKTTKGTERYRELVRSGRCPRCGGSPRNNDTIYCENCKQEIDAYRRLRIDRQRFMKAARTLGNLYKKLPEHELEQLEKEAAEDTGMAVKPIKAKDRT